MTFLSLHPRSRSAHASGLHAFGKPCVLALITLSCFFLSCRHRDPRAVYDQSLLAFERGRIREASEQADRGYKEFRSKGPQWALRFAVLRGRIFLWQGMPEEALRAVSPHDLPRADGDLEVARLRVEAAANTKLHKVAESERLLAQAEGFCAALDYPACVDVASARAKLQMEQGQFKLAQDSFSGVLVKARAHSDPFQEASALLDLSWAADEQGRFDEALDWSDSALHISKPLHFEDTAQTALGNMGWAYYKLGDSEQAREMFIEAGKQAEELGDTLDQEKWLGNLAYIQMDADDFSSAEQSFRHQLKLAQQIHSVDDILDALIGLAFVSEKSGKLDEAQHYADDALLKARADHDAGDEEELRLLQGRVAADRHDHAIAETAFRRVASSADAPDLKWEAERSLARLLEDENQPEAAETEYQTALTTFEIARCSHQRIDSRLPFLSNAARIYEGYIHFLVTRGKPNEALQVADYTRARTLAEGLGRPCKAGFAPDPFNAPAIARRAGGAILFYALGKEHSYVWAITARETKMFPIIFNEDEIDAAVQRYREKLEGPPAILAASDDGSVLFKMLVTPAQDFLKRELAAGEPIFIVADGSLNNLSFETLNPEGSAAGQKRYWIEDATIVNAPSLRMLPDSRRRAEKLEGNLLLLGDPASPTAGLANLYPPLPNAAIQMQTISKYFSDDRQKVFAHDQASPSAYLKGHPEQFSYIHFVAHGTANRTDPLESAIILSPETSTAGDDSFKLYARDIIGTPRLRAQVVTISACYSSGKRTYSGEGLVGLSWAFLRAGAHHVVAALWDVSDASAPPIMDAFYRELKNGKSPGSALRTAKLSLLHSQDFRSPFYWAAFQLYTGQ